MNFTKTFSSRILVFTAAAVAVAASAASAESRKFKANGSYISMAGYDASGCVWTAIYVNRGGTRAEPQTYLNYYSVDVCTGTELAYGWGSISNAALKISGNRATLDVSPASISGFESAGSTGRIQLAVEADRAWTYEYSGHERSASATFSFQRHGSATYKSAQAAGRVFGVQLDQLRGQLGESREMYLEFERVGK
jgi:hypothetical protein